MADIKEIIINSQVSKLGRSGLGKAQSVVPPRSGEQFEKALDQESLKISKHALRRLDSREISLNQIDQTKLNEAVDSLEKKGAKNSLVMMGELAFIVNVPSKTVLTAISKDQMKEQVFTNIDSTIFVDR